MLINHLFRHLFAKSSYQYLPLRIPVVLLSMIITVVTTAVLVINTITNYLILEPDIRTII